MMVDMQVMPSALFEPLLVLSSYALSSLGETLAALFSSNLDTLVLFAYGVSLSHSSLGTVPSHTFADANDGVMGDKKAYGQKTAASSLLTREIKLIY